MASNIARAAGVTWTGRRSRSSTLSNLAAFAIAPPRMGIEPWPADARAVALIQQICFSATMMG
jgi:hypothetical protein